MQTQLPFFPDSTRLINPTLGIFQNEGFVYYLHNGNPIYCHSKDDLKGYRFISGNLVVNREYSNIQYGIKKERGKLSQLKATLYSHLQEIPEEREQGSAAMKKWISRQLTLNEQIDTMTLHIDQKVARRKTIPYKIPIRDMPQTSRYVKLHQESKYVQNIIKMICYRAETALADKLAPYYGRAGDEIRALVKAITRLSIDLMPDMQNKLLCITLYPLANKRSQLALAAIIEEVNATHTLYPGTDLVMNFKMATV